MLEFHGWILRTKNHHLESVETESDTDDNNIQYNTNEIKVDDSFRDWNTVQCVVDAYAKKHGFVANKYRKDLDAIDKSIIRRRDYNCWKSGINKPKKLKILMHTVIVLRVK